MKLIDKDYAVDTAWSIEVYHGSAREVCEMLEDAPTVELIRCKDCKHYADECCDRYADETLGYVHSTQEYGYCWVAERKEE